MSRATTFFLILISFFSMKCASQEDSSPNFIDLSNDSSTVSIPYYSGMNGYYSFRIPTLINTRNALIAFAEGRKNSTSDFGDIDIVYRRSTDRGKTWEPMQVLYDLDTMAVQNPVPIYMSAENKVVLLFNTTSMSEHDVLNKDYDLKDERKAFMTSSTGNGKTWETPREITRQVKLKHWRWHALGPVHGIELKTGKNKGRLVAPVAISIEKGNKAYCMALIYSDDSGNNWKIGAVDENLTDAVQANETTLVRIEQWSEFMSIHPRPKWRIFRREIEGKHLVGMVDSPFKSLSLNQIEFPSPIVAIITFRLEGQKKSNCFFRPLQPPISAKIWSSCPAKTVRKPGKLFLRCMTDFRPIPIWCKWIERH